MVELEMGEDGLERNERAAVESFKESGSQLNRIMEKNILLEGEVGEKKSVSEENRRSRDANSERGHSLTIQQYKISFMPAVSPDLVVTSSPISSATASPVVPRDMELKDLPPSPTTSTLASSTSSRFPQRQASLRPRLSFSTTSPPHQPRPLLPRAPPSRGLSMVNGMCDKTKAVQTKTGVGLPKIQPWLNSFTRAVTISTSSSKSGAPINSSVLGFGGKNERQPPQ